MNMKKNTDQSKIRRKLRGISTYLCANLTPRLQRFPHINGHRRSSPSLCANGETEELLRDFRNSVNTREKVENTMDLDDYLDFLHQIHDFAGHPKARVTPMSGNRFLL